MLGVIRRSALLLSIAGVLTSTAGCGDHEGSKDRSLNLLEPKKAPEVDLTAEQERLQKMQMIKYQAFDASGHPNGDPIEMSASELSRQFNSDCIGHAATSLPKIAAYDWRQHYDPPYPLPASTGTDAESALLATELCRAKRLEEVAAASAVPVDYATRSEDGTLTTTVRILPQKDSVKVALYEEARKSYLHAATRALDLLQGGKITTFDTFAGSTPNGASTWHYPVNLYDETIPGPERALLAARISETLSSAILGYESATLAAAEKTVAVADAQRGSTSSPTLSSHRVWAGEALSRSAAAHMLLGGAPGLEVAGQPSDGFCVNDTLTSGARRALAALREAGVPVETIASNTDTATLVDGLACSGSVRERLAAKRKDDRLLTTLSACDAVGATLEDFRAAREYLRSEQRAFGVLANDALRVSKLALTCGPNGAKPVVPYDFGTAMPTERGIAWFASTARAGLTWNIPWRLEDLAGGPELGLAQFYEIVSDTLTNLALPPAEGATAAEIARYQLVTDHMPSLALTIKHISEIEVGRLWWLVGEGEDVGIYLEMREAVGTDPLLLVQGYEAAECYTRGAVNGEPRTQAQCPAVAAQMEYTPSANAGFTAGYGAIVTLAGSLRGDRTTPLYVVGPNPTGKGRAIVASFKPTRESEYFPGARTIIGVAPSLEEHVGRILKPGKNWCSRPAYECGGRDLFDGRISAELPLENELGTDGDPVESSWRYYLERAATAASEADSLGESYLQSALELEKDKEADEASQYVRRSEADRELEVVQEVCGTAVDGSVLQNFLSPSGAATTDVNLIAECDSSHACSSGLACIAGRCSCSVDKQCPAKYPECVAGKCIQSGFGAVVDGGSYAGATYNRLFECLGSATVLPWVASGNQGLCFWEYKNVSVPSARVEPCKGSNSNAQCPIFVTDSQGAKPCEAAKAKSYLSSEEKALAPVQVVKSGLGLFNLGDTVSDIRKALYPFGVPLTDEGRIPVDDSIMSALNALITKPQACGAFSFESDLYNPEQSNAALPSKEKTKQFMDKVKASLECYQQRLVAGLSSRVFANVPDRVAAALKADSAVMGAYPSVGGTYGEKMVQLRAALNRYSLHGNLIKEEFAATVADYDTMMKTIDQLGLQHQISAGNDQIAAAEQTKADLSISILDLQKDAAVINGMIQIAQAEASLDWMNPQSALGVAAGVAGAILLTDNQLQQLDQQKNIARVDQQILKLQKANQDFSTQQQYIGYAKELVAARTAIRTRTMNVKKYVNEMHSAYEDFDAALVGLESERNRALRALSRATQAITTRYVQEEVVDMTLSAITKLRQDRYEAARKNAVKWATMAKRAIEERLGVHLAELTNPMALLDQAPSAWENEICVSTGISLNVLKQGDGASPALATAYVGDYVDKLRRLVESYRIEYGFSDGSDQLVMSLKDDIDQVTESCTAKSRNLIRMSGDIASGGLGSLALNQPWEGVICGQVGASAVIRNDATAVTSGDMIVLCAANPASTYVLKQSVSLASGRYLMSWYGEAGKETSGFKLRSANGAVIAPVSVKAGKVNGTDLRRHFAVYDLATDGSFDVFADGAGLPNGASNLLVAPSLELVTSANSVGSTEAVVPVAFEATDALGMHQVSGCSDLDGSTFRGRHWARKCVPICENGVDTGCLVSSGPERCYWETSFGLSQRDIEQGYLLPRGGFALGNFNYRVESIAVNFVGSALRSCDEAGGQACYSQGFIPYSLVQGGPFTVVNQAGHLFSSSLFDGRIEHAKGLALERYLSNPLSSADRGLIEPFARSEFAGRPFDGSYVLRVWEEPGVKFDSIEDVQVLLKYRYWTRLN